MRVSVKPPQASGLRSKRLPSLQTPIASIRSAALLVGQLSIRQSHNRHVRFEHLLERLTELRMPQSLYLLVYYKGCQRRQWYPTPVLLPGKSHGQRSLVGCSRWGCKESDMTERLHFDFPLLCIGEGNGSPLQCSCLGNPGDRGAWWATVYGITQSRTRLKRLSSSSSMKDTDDHRYKEKV